MWGCAAAKGPSTTAEHLVSGLRGTETLIQELFVRRSKATASVLHVRRWLKGGVDPREQLGGNGDFPPGGLTLKWVFNDPNQEEISRRAGRLRPRDSGRLPEVLRDSKWRKRSRVFRLNEAVKGKPRPSSPLKVTWNSFVGWWPPISERYLAARRVKEH